MFPAIMAGLGGVGAGGAAAGGGMGAAAGGMGSQFMSWLDMFDPEAKGSILEKLGMLKPNQGAISQNTGMQMSGLKDMSKPAPTMNMQQMMGMAQGRPMAPPRPQPPQGLMAPPQRSFKGTGLWG
jgi:hypothetical protein